MFGYIVEGQDLLTQLQVRPVWLFRCGYAVMWRELRAHLMCCGYGQVGDLIEEMKVVDGLQYLEEPKNTA